MTFCPVGLETGLNPAQGGAFCICWPMISLELKPEWSLDSLPILLLWAWALTLFPTIHCTVAVWLLPTIPCCSGV